MKKRTASTKKIMAFGVFSILLGTGQQAYATGFQVYEQNAAGTGDYHAGWAADANDASTEYYNPAGLVRIQKQQIVVSGAIINVDEQFNGTVTRSNLGTETEAGTAEGGGINFIPTFHYALPVNQRLVLAFGLNVPFGLATSYSPTGIARYAATDTSITTVDLTPGFGFAITKKLSIGAGLDLAYSMGTFDSVAGTGSCRSGCTTDTTSNNEGDGWGIGWHGGALYQFTPRSRIGVAYHSPIRFDATGTSTFTGPLAPGGQVSSDNFNTDLELPGYANFSILQGIGKFDVMASADWTGWNEFNQIVLNNVMVPTPTQVIVPQNFRNTWNFAIGGDYHLNQKWLFRTGFGYDMTPTNSTDRNLQLPDEDRFAAAVGAHYQATPDLGFDAGYTHFFVLHTDINNTQSISLQTTTTTGTVNTAADVLGVQLTWNI